ncbi:hypothetical protein V8G54_005675 [Vigna mungo]|uniref:Uncharacterized protein n=1 Tax=Vigna mungo TaxID=3915 RepID=A0AAQ3P1X5_VIGMU
MRKTKFCDGPIAHCEKNLLNKLGLRKMKPTMGKKLAISLEARFTSMASSELITTEVESENHLSSLIYEISNEVQEIMENMLKTITEINHNSAVIEEEIEKCKGSALERKRALDEDRDNFQKAAYAVLDMLNRE